MVQRNIDKFMLGAIQGFLVEMEDETLPNVKFYKMVIPSQDIAISSISEDSCTDGNGNKWIKCI